MRQGWADYADNHQDQEGAEGCQGREFDSKHLGMILLNSDNSNGYGIYGNLGQAGLISTPGQGKPTTHQQKDTPGEFCLHIFPH